MAAYIKFDGVDGEATAKEHRSWSRIVSFDQGIHQPGAASAGSTRRRGSVVLEDITVSKKLDKSSPKIAEAVCKGKVFPQVLIDLTVSYADAGRLTYYSYELTNVLVTSYKIQGSGRPKGVPVEEFALNFEEIKVTYTELSSKGKAKGDVEYSWKVEEGEVVVNLAISTEEDGVSLSIQGEHHKITAIRVKSWVSSEHSWSNASSV